MLKKTKRKIVTSAIISSCSLAIIAGVGGFVFFTGLADADYSKGLAFNAKGMVRYGFTKKADFVTSDHSINPIDPTKATGLPVCAEAEPSEMVALICPYPLVMTEACMS